MWLNYFWTLKHSKKTITPTDVTFVIKLKLIKLSTTSSIKNKPKNLVFMLDVGESRQNLRMNLFLNNLPTLEGKHVFRKLIV